MKYLLLTVLLLNLSGVVSCKKGKVSNNEIVTLNNMSFGCRVNGQPFIADHWDYGNNIPPLKIKMLNSGIPGVLPNHNYMWVRADKANSQISLYIKPLLIVGRKLLIKTTLPYPLEIRPEDYGMYSIFSPSADYITSETVKGYIDIITVDTIQRKIEARFEFEAIDKQSGKKVTVTNGYFKLN